MKMSSTLKVLVKEPTLTRLSNPEKREVFSWFSRARLGVRTRGSILSTEQFIIGVLPRAVVRPGLADKASTETAELVQMLEEAQSNSTTSQSLDDRAGQKLVADAVLSKMKAITAPLSAEEQTRRKAQSEADKRLYRKKLHKKAATSLRKSKSCYYKMGKGQYWLDEHARSALDARVKVKLRVRSCKPRKRLRVIRDGSVEKSLTRYFS